jgi:hypothetical protein
LRKQHIAEALKHSLIMKNRDGEHIALNLEFSPMLHIFRSLSFFPFLSISHQLSEVQIFRIFIYVFFFYCGPFLYCPWAFYCIGSWLGVSGQFLLTNNRNNNLNYVYSLYVDIRLCVARVVSFEFHFLSLFYCL